MQQQVHVVQGLQVISELGRNKAARLASFRHAWRKQRPCLSAYGEDLPVGDWRLVPIHTGDSDEQEVSRINLMSCCF